MACTHDRQIWMDPAHPVCIDCGEIIEREEKPMNDPSLILAHKRSAAMAGFVKNITLNNGAETPTYRITVEVAELTDHHITELLALHKMSTVRIVIEGEEAQNTFALGADRPEGQIGRPQ